MVRISPYIAAMMLIAVTFTVSAGCATASSDKDPDPEVFAAEVDRRLDSDPNKRTCRTIRPTGSRLGERVCKTNYEWAKIAADSQSAIRRVQQDQTVVTGGDE